LKKSFNNKVYTLSTSSHSSYILRLSKLTWPKEKIECEICALKWIRLHTTIPVPRVYTYDSDGKEFGFRWILMAKMNGSNLDDEWKYLLEK